MLLKRLVIQSVTHIHELQETIAITGLAAERVGFEPTEGFTLRLISSQRYKCEFSITCAIFF